MNPGFRSCLRICVLGFFAICSGLTAEVQPRGGELLYQQRCLICHGPEGRGVPGVFPPLAEADWLKKHRDRTIRALCEGLSGRIRVNDVDYEGSMPAQALNDAEVAEVLTFIGKTWGNSLPAFTADEVKAVRSKTRFPTFDSLVKASTYQPLPAPPPGYSVREIVRLPEEEFGTRLAGDGKTSVVYLLTQAGSVWRLDAESGALEKLFSPADYLDLKRGGISALGICLGADNRLWITTNQQIKPPQSYPLNEVVIHRTPPIPSGGEKPGKPQAWFTYRYPHGGGFNHGVSHLAFGPDGLLYVSSGSRTDGGEKPPNHPDSPTGESDTTACLWRMDPSADSPAIEVIGRGLRNAYGFAWDPAGNLFTVSNGPDANSPEEMDHIQTGKHYGFPYQFANWPVAAGKPYPHTPTPPSGVTFTLPVKNQGPAAGGTPEGMFTFDPHSSPGGMIWCGNDFPAPLGGGFLLTRYGNLLGADRTGIGEDVGFDVLSMQLRRDKDGQWVARTESVLAPLGRPIDVIRIGPGRALILEYTRPTNFKERLGWLSGRVIELRAKANQ